MTHLNDIEPPDGTIFALFFRAVHTCFCSALRESTPAREGAVRNLLPRYLDLEIAWARRSIGQARGKLLDFIAEGRSWLDEISANPTTKIETSRASDNFRHPDLDWVWDGFSGILIGA